MNFNFGEHFYEAVNSSIYYDLLITFISAFLGFLAALMINRVIDWKSLKKEKKEEKRNYYSHLRHLSQLLDSILTNYPKQAKNYLNLSIAVKEKPLEIELPNLRATYDLSRLKDLDSKILRDSYFHFFSNTEKSIDNYGKLFANVDFLLMLFNDLIKQNENHRNFIHKDQLFVRDCIEEVSYRLGIRQKNIQKNNPENFQNIMEYQYLHEFGTIFIKTTKGSIDFQIIREEYLQPLHDTILYEIKDVELADSIFVLVKKAISRLRNIEFNSLEFARDMEKVESRISNGVEFLTKLNEEIKKKNKL